MAYLTYVRDDTLESQAAALIYMYIWVPQDPNLRYSERLGNTLSINCTKYDILKKTV